MFGVEKGNGFRDFVEGRFVAQHLRHQHLVGSLKIALHELRCGGRQLRERS